MKRSFAIFLQIVVVALGAGALAFLLWEPHLEGRNAHATLFEIYFQDPFLAYVYIGSVPFFVALYRISEALRYAGRGMAYSPEVAQALRTIRYSAMILIGFVVGGGAWIMSIESDDRAGGVVMGLLVALGASAVAVAAAMLERRIRDVMTRDASFSRGNL